MLPTPDTMYAVTKVVNKMCCIMLLDKLVSLLHHPHRRHHRHHWWHEWITQEILWFLLGRSTIVLLGRVIYHLLQRDQSFRIDRRTCDLSISLKLLLQLDLTLLVYRSSSLRFSFVVRYLSSLENTWNDVSCCCVCSDCCNETNHCHPTVKLFCFWCHLFVPCNCLLKINLVLSIRIDHSW